MRRRTKIVCTLGPAVNTREKIEALIEAGMNVARLNFSHGTHEDHGKTIDLLKEIRERLKIPLAIMLDTKGPELRLGKLKNSAVEFHKGDQFWLVKEAVEGDLSQISITPENVIDHLKPGMRVVLDNGYIITHVVEIQKDRAKIELENNGIIRSTKGVSVPGVIIDFPPLIQKDIDDIRFGCQKDIDLIAASFIRNAEQVILIKKLLEEEGKSDISVIAKIENIEGVDNIDSIIQVSDGIMVARGDLAMDLPFTQVPRVQKMIIRKCHLAGKPSITATQMLESMITNPLPTRAEASDVANAIYDSSSAVMLSGETAAGSYPIEAVRTMSAVVEDTEKDFNYREFLRIHSEESYPDVPSSVTLACVKTAYSAQARAIFAYSASGLTARLLGRLRPEMPLIIMTGRPKVYHKMALNWGVVPLFYPDIKTGEEAYKELSRFALSQGYVKDGDVIVISSGTPFGRPKTTNTMIVDSIGDVLVRGKSGFGNSISGQVILVHSPEGIKDYTVKGKIIVISQCDERFLPLLKNAMGVILNNMGDDTLSENYLLKFAESQELPILLRAENAFSILHNEQLITLVPSQAIVYKGVYYN